MYEGSHSTSGSHVSGSWCWVVCVGVTVTPDARDSLQPVRELIGDASARILSIEVSPLEYRSFLPGRRLWRVSGEVDTFGRHRRFALVAKDTAKSSRESVMYESSVLSDLSGCISTPRFVGAQSVPDGQRIWMEEVADDQPGPWDYSRCVRVAGCIATLTAELHGHAPPAGLPMGRDRQQDDPGAWSQATKAVEQLIDNPQLAQPWYSAETLNRILNVLNQRDALEDLAQQLPMGMAHTDCGRHNLLTSHQTRSDDRYYLIDWEDAAIGPIGLDLAAFVNGTLITGGLDPAACQEFSRDAETEFVRQLVHIDPEAVAEKAILGYRVESTLRWAPHIHGATVLAGLSTRGSFSNHWTEGFEELMDRRTKLTEMFLTRGESIAE